MAIDPAVVASPVDIWQDAFAVTAESNSEQDAPVLYNSPRKLRPFLELAAESGVEVSQLLAAHDTTLEAMAHPDTRLPRPQLVAIMRALLAGMADPLAGLHAADRFVLEDLDLLGYLARQCPTPLDALETVVGYAPLINDASRASLTRSEGTVILAQWLDGDPAQLPELTDYMLASSHVGVSLLAGEQVAALRVELARPAPSAADQLRAYRSFFGGPVTFQAARSKLVYPEALLRKPSPSSDLRLALLLSRQAEARLEHTARPASFREQVREQLQIQLREGKPDPSQLARGLRMSSRTMRRKLSAAGCSYRSLLEHVRREEALRMMQSGELAVGEAAERLGFEDASAFARAFRRWTGVRPSQLKRRSR